MVTSFIAGCFLMVLLYQTPVSTAPDVCIDYVNIRSSIVLWISLQSQVCLHPYCPSSTTFNSSTCHCHDKTDAICPRGYTLIRKPNCQCVCQKRYNPTCPTGLTLDSKTCNCSVCKTPTCPSGSTPELLHYTCSSKPTCDLGGEPTEECVCIHEICPECPPGSQLSDDRCFCVVVSNPTCSMGCVLNSNTRQKECSCELV